MQQTSHLNLGCISEVQTCVGQTDVYLLTKVENLPGENFICGKGNI